MNFLTKLWGALKGTPKRTPTEVKPTPAPAPPVDPAFEEFKRKYYKSAVRWRVLR